MPGRSHQIAEGLWTIDGDTIPFVTFPYELRATIVRLDDGSLFLHSPVQLAVARTIVDELGEVAHLVSPNKLHHLFLGQWASAYPAAKLYAPPGLARKRSDLAFTAELTDTPEPAWASVLDQRVVRGSFVMEEVVFLHRVTRTLILGDLVENHDPTKLGWIHRLVARANAMVAPHGTTPRNYRWSFLHRAPAREAIRDILAWRPERIIVMHGPCVERGATAFLENAFGWLL